MSFFQPGPPVRVKICGITTPSDAEMAVDARADGLGFNFYPRSKRFLDFDKARQWIASLAGRVERIAVVVNASADEIAALRDSGCFEGIQFHGDESPEFCKEHGFGAWIRAVRVKDSMMLEQSLAYQTPFLLFDAWSPTEYGGTGRRLDWDLARRFAVAHPDRNIIVAGGLAAHNVRMGIRIVRPYGVDVCGGVESSPGIKDESLVREFVHAAHST